MLNIEWDIHRFAIIESTNLIVKQAIRERKPAGFVAVATQQTGGLGMRGHTWQSPAGGLYFSLLLEPTLPASQLPTIPMKIAKSTRDALQPFSREPLTIKPLNDIVLKRSYSPANSTREKLVGISTEIYQARLCVGIGINVFRPSVQSSQTQVDPRSQNIINIPVFLQDFAAQPLNLETILQHVLAALNDKLIV